MFKKMTSQKSYAITTSPKHLINTNTKFTCHTMWPFSPFYGRLLWQVRSKSPHLPALTLPECHRSLLPMAGDFWLGARFYHQSLAALPSCTPYRQSLAPLHSEQQNSPAMAIPCRTFCNSSPMAGDFLLTASHSSPEQITPRNFIL